LLDRVERKLLQRSAHRVVGVVSTVDDVTDVPPVAAGHLRHVLAAFRRVAMKPHAHSWQGPGKIRELSAVQREPIDPSALDDASHLR